MAESETMIARNILLLSGELFEFILRNLDHIDNNILPDGRKVYCSVINIENLPDGAYDYLNLTAASLLQKLLGQGFCEVKLERPYNDKRVVVTLYKPSA